MGGNRKHLAMTISPNKWELDVQAYLNTCNITAATPRKQIRDFSAGVNDLGLWNSMVCWPLRSSQNYGSGTTAFSLGGLGTFNGTLTNGPTWGADGVNFNATTAHILANGTISQPLTIVGSVNFKTAINAGGLIDGTSRVHLWNGGQSNQMAMFAGNTILDGPNFSVGHNFIGGYFDGANSVKYVNSSSQAGNAGSNSLGNTNIILGNNNSLSFGDSNMDIAFCAIFSGQPYNDSVRALYKQTLGTGLSLP